MKRLFELFAALAARRILRWQIARAGRPPHTDFWHQSIAEANARVDRARCDK